MKEGLKSRNTLERNQNQTCAAQTTTGRVKPGLQVTARWIKISKNLKLLLITTNKKAETKAEVKDKYFREIENTSAKTEHKQAILEPFEEDL